MRFCEILVILIVLTATSICAQDTDEPVWLPGMSAYNTPFSKLSSNGRYVVFHGRYDYRNFKGVTVLDMQTAKCALVELLTLNTDQRFFRASCSVVSEDGDNIVIIRPEKVAWYHTGDAQPWWTEDIDTIEMLDPMFIGDSLVVVKETFDTTYTVHFFRPDASGSSIAGPFFTYGYGEPVFTGRGDEVLFVHGDTLRFSSQQRTDSFTILPYSGMVNYSTTNNRMYLWSDSAAAVFNLNSRQVEYSSKGEFLGRFGATQFAMWQNELCTLHDPATMRVDSLPFRVSSSSVILRGQFLLSGDSVIDLSTVQAFAIPFYPQDILPDRTLLHADPFGGLCEVIRDSQTLVHFRTSTGIVFDVTQDPRDSVIIFASGYPRESGNRSLSRFDNGSIVETSSAGALYSIGSIRTLAGEPAFEYLANDRGSTTGGYYRFKDSIEREVELRRSPDEVITFTERGDAMWYSQSYFSVLDCSGRTYDSIRSNLRTAPVRGKPWIVAQGYRINYETCSDSIKLPYTVIGVAPTGTCALTATDSTVALVDIEHIGTTYVQLTLPNITYAATWADSGKTVRMYSGDSIVSLHSDGSTSSLRLPQSMLEYYRRYWSNDGRVLTKWKRDTVISIDAVTGRILREYYSAPWMKKSRSTEIDYSIKTTPIDGSLVVSLFTGPFIVLPGVTPDYATSVNNSNATQEQFFDINSINSTALNGSTVYVYSMFGELLGTETTPITTIENYSNNTRYPIVIRFNTPSGWHSQLMH